jgi:hypothetical protein
VSDVKGAQEIECCRKAAGLSPPAFRFILAFQMFRSRPASIKSIDPERNAKSREKQNMLLGLRIIDPIFHSSVHFYTELSEPACVPVPPAGVTQIDAICACQVASGAGCPAVPLRRPAKKLLAKPLG